MKKHLLFLVLIFTLKLSAQMVLDAPFINERHMFNECMNPLSRFDMNHDLWVDSKSMNLKSYTFDEPYYWRARKYYKILRDFNPKMYELNLEDSIMPITTIIRNAIETEKVMAFRTLDLVEVLDSAEIKSIDFNYISQLVIKSDFYFDYDSLQLNSAIISVGIEIADTIVASFYFPELFYALNKYYVNTPNERLRMGDFMRQWMFVPSSHIDEYEHGRPACGYCSPPTEEQDEFDALISLYCIEHELSNKGVNEGQILGYTVNHPIASRKEKFISVVNNGDTLLYCEYRNGLPDGRFTEYHLNGTIKQKGIFSEGHRIGNWLSYYPNNQVKTNRNYDQGLLEGIQTIYYSSGVIHYEFEMNKGEYSGRHISNYPDGSQRWSGQMDRGYVYGQWDYQLYIDETVRAEILAKPSWYNITNKALEDGILKYKVNYEFNWESDGCPYVDCFKGDYLGEIE